MKTFLKLILVFMFILTACSREHKGPAANLFTVAQNNNVTSLFYTGIIKPVRTMVIPSPADGVVIDMPFQYGEEVKSGQLLFVLSSLKFMTDYKAALMQFVKAKSDFNNSQTQLDEAKFLYKNELISKDDFKTKQSNYYGNRLALLQARDALEILMHQLAIKDVNLYQLTIADIDKITQAMHLKTNSENLSILAIAGGVVLSPSKSEEDNKKLLKGDSIKQGDVLAIIGDMNGVSVQIKINELAVNQIKIGQAVKVTGIAFPEYVLDGKITRIDKQGEASNGGLPSFTAEVIVPKLTAKQKQDIHVGMSAKVEINIVDESQIMVPIKAIVEKQGASYVKLYDAKLKQIKEKLVQTGKTSNNSVTILSELKNGDQIVLPD
jgi:HlyD family secretion protein